MNSSSDNLVRAAGILLFCDNPSRQFLLMRHRNRWDLPKGHCDNGETFLETALRETEEETGIGSQQLRVDPDFEFVIEYDVKYKRWGNQVRRKQVCYFLAFLDSKPELEITEHESATWFDWHPPHKIQAETMDDLLAAAANHLAGQP